MNSSVFSACATASNIGTARLSLRKERSRGSGSSSSRAGCSSTGEKKNLGYLVEGQCFGEVSLLMDAPHSASARADADTILLAVQRTVLSENMPALGYKVLEYIAGQLADKLIKANIQIENLDVTE
ncbi:MAG TPA: hypothetical protein DDZ83_10745 [Nitrospinae bacterium]|nr:hypothetical protein [Nitrospinota bacterium]